MRNVEIIGEAQDGSEVQRVVLASGDLTATVLSFGAVLQDLRIADHASPLVLGYPDFRTYFHNPGYLGAIVGRYANRIASARFELGGTVFCLEPNEGPNQLHGGTGSSALRNWKIQDAGDDWVELSDHLPDGHMGFPGNLSVVARYAIIPPTTLCLTITATTDAPTLANFTGHSYFNLDGRDDLSRHLLQIHASDYLPVSSDGLPISGPAPVAGTAFDFRAMQPLVRSGRMTDLDHNFCTDHGDAHIAEVARLAAPEAGLELSVSSNQPGLQVYTAASLCTPPGLNGKPYGAFAGLAVEPQVWPDAPNRAEFPSAVLRPGQPYRHETVYCFERSPRRE